MIVTAVCLQNRDYVARDGCPSALQAYYHTNPALGRMVRRQERYVRQLPYGDAVITYGFVPTYTLLVARRFTVPVTARVSLVLNFGDPQAMLEYSLPF